MPAAPSGPLQVLLVEDNDWDAKLVTEALAQAELPVVTTRAFDGVEALALLRSGPPGQAKPELVLLDLNLPGKTGLQVLAEMRRDPRLRTVAVVVLTSSQAPQDILAAYVEHANSYVVKPFDPKEYGRFVKDLEAFWRGWNMFPS